MEVDQRERFGNSWTLDKVLVVWKRRKQFAVELYNDQPSRFSYVFLDGGKKGKS